LYNIVTSIGNPGVFLMPANICPIVVAAFLKAGVEIEFVDISNLTLCMDEEIIIKKISACPSRYSGILFVRSYGVRDSFEYFFGRVKAINHNIIIIDDKCVSIPSFDEDLRCADVNLYSTGYSKYVDLGWGAFANLKSSIAYQRKQMVYRATDLAEISSQIRKAIDNPTNIELQQIESDWLDTATPEIEFELYKKIVLDGLSASRVIKEAYDRKFTEGLLPAIQLPKKFQNWRFNILVPHKEKLLAKIFDAGLFASSHFKPSTRIFEDIDQPNSDLLHSRIVNLFTDRYFKFENVDELIYIINDHVQEHLTNQTHAA